METNGKIPIVGRTREPAAGHPLARLQRASGEVSGAFGDLGTLLPYAVAVLGAGILAPAPVFLGFAAGYVLVALVYRVPIAVQPMKALGALIITGGLTASGAALAGAIVGAVLLLFAATPALGKAARAIPQSVTTGLQAGLGLMLGAVALAMMAADWRIGLAAGTVLGMSLFWPRGPWALLVVAGSLVLGHLADAPAIAIAMPEGGTAFPAVLSGVLAQLPLTLLNAVVLAAVVARALYPEAQAVNERKLAATSGFLNVFLAPFGAMPLCHGAGGIAAHHRFGARGAGAPLVMAGCCVVLALLGPTTIDLLLAIPQPVVGALLAWAAADLIFGRRLFDARPDCRPVIGVAALATFLGGPLLGLIAGLAAETLRALTVRALRARAAGRRQ